MIIKKCKSCGAVVKVLNDCNCEDCKIKCCDQPMEVIKPNSFDATVEKHVPTYEIDNNMMNIKVNHVMNDDHYIEWISIVDGDSDITFYMQPGDIPEIRHEYIKGAKIYAYCNLHSLWETTVE